MSPAPDVSVIIVNWNGGDLLQDCLESITSFTGDCSIEIIVVDNASIDGSIEVLEKRFPEVISLRQSRNLGFAAANNVGIKSAAGRYIACINSDVEVACGVFDGLVRFMDSHPDIGMAGPRVLNPDGTHQSSCHHFPSISRSLKSALGLDRLPVARKLFSGEHMAYWAQDSVSDVDVLVGCFWMVRAQAIRDVGGLDERFFIYSEDVDWCRRMQQRGWRVVLWPHVSVVHHRKGSSRRDEHRFNWEQKKSNLQYWKKYHGRTGVVLISTVTFLHLVTSHVYAVVRRKPKPSLIASLAKFWRLSQEIGSTRNA